uniref:PUM-HD domain-containing protein n=1 Tax=Oryza glumipatula TaxID=40148 RepID=A0A0D9ZXH7_9ORYZ
MAEVVAVLLPPPPPSPPAAFFSWPSLNYVLVNDQYANYFMQKVIETCDEWQHKIILECLRMRHRQLRNCTYAKHEVARIERHIEAGGRLSICFPP